MNRKIKISVALITLLMICSCGPITPLIDSRKASTETFSLGQVQEKIKKGITIKSEVLILIGSPNLVSKNREGKEVHVWDKRSSESERSQGIGTSVVIQNERTITIAITYDNKDVVEDISYRVTSY